MNRKKDYRDIGRWRETCRRQTQRYYDKTATFQKIPWTQHDIDLIIRHEHPDRELSRMTGHSVRAIQVKRSRLRMSSNLQTGGVM